MSIFVFALLKPSQAPQLADPGELFVSVTLSTGRRAEFLDGGVSVWIELPSSLLGTFGVTLTNDVLSSARQIESGATLLQ
jgi:hypothetical protein